MKLLNGVVIAGVLFLAAAPSYAQMMDKMDKHMEEHMEKRHKKTEAKNTETKKAEGVAQEAEAAGVTVKTTYTNPGEKSPVFTVVLDTHTVDLEGYKFEEIIFLRDAAGAIFKPALVAESGSGHHREATVEFKDAAVQSKAFELVVKGVAGVGERVFAFDSQKKMGDDHSSSNGK